MIEATIYALCDNETPFYVGVTKQDLDTRLSCHISASKVFTYPAYKYMTEKRITPKIIKLKTIRRKTRSGLLKAEKEVIKEMVANGVVLMNNQFHPEKYKNNEKSYNVSISPTMHTKVKVYAAENGITMADAVNELLKQII